MLLAGGSKHIQKSTDYFWHVPVSFVIEIHFPERILMAQLIVYQMLLVRHMADQGVGTEGNAHALAGKVISCDLLIQLRTHLWKEVGIVEDSVSAFPCVVSAF